MSNTMSRLLNILLLVLVLVLLFSHVTADTALRPVLGVVKEGPRSVLTIYYEADKDGKPPPMSPGEFYVLKVLNSGRSTYPGKPPFFVDYGFVRLEVEE